MEELRPRPERASSSWRRSSPLIPSAAWRGCPGSGTRRRTASDCPLRRRGYSSSPSRGRALTGVSDGFQRRPAPDVRLDVTPNVRKLSFTISLCASEICRPAYLRICQTCAKYAKWLMLQSPPSSMVSGCRQNQCQVEARISTPCKWVPGVEGASGATGYEGSLGDPVAGFVFGRARRGRGDETGLVAEEVERARGRTLVFRLGTDTKRPAPHSGHSTRLPLRGRAITLGPFRAAPAGC